jgi:fatty acid desaturase
VGGHVDVVASDFDWGFRGGLRKTSPLPQGDGLARSPIRGNMLLMPAPKIDPKTIFTPQEWDHLRHRDDVISLGLVAHAWGLIALAVALFAWMPNIVTWSLAVMIVGARQLGLAILMHEAAHGGLAKNQKTNDFVGQWLCGAPVGAPLGLYRPYHLTHHRNTQQKDDPDLGLAAHFPISKDSLKRKMIRDITGQTFYKQRIASLIKFATGGWRVYGPARDATLAYLGTNAVVFLIFAAFGQAWAFVTIWVVAQATWYPLVTRIRNIGEHACATPDPSDPWRLARTTYANWLERLLIAPYWVHFHAEHHLWMHIPCYRLEAAHTMLAAKGLTAQMEVRNGYREILALATART